MSMSQTNPPNPQEVQVRDEEAVRWIVLHRPESKNGLTIETNEKIIAALRAAAEDATVRVVAIYGAGGSFCSGLDLRQAASAGGSPSDVEHRGRTYFHGMIRAVAACPKPVVALVDGHAVGFGCDLALVCDLRFCSDRAKFGEIFVRRGLMPDGGGTFSLPRIVGAGRALEMMLTGDIVEAEEALRIGLANRVVPADGFEAAARAYLAKLAAGAPLVHQAVKRCVQAAATSNLDAALDAELTNQLRLLQSKDFFEGIAAFFQKRPPQFKGE
jgi:2-(1,2-epoxy-1,2-dihydrophenyl)acetyl-CoA isomerase